MKKIYRYNRKGLVHYFTTLKKAYNFAKDRGASVTKNYAQFKRWHDTDGFYQLDGGGIVDHIIVY